MTITRSKLSSLSSRFENRWFYFFSFGGETCKLKFNGSFRVRNLNFFFFSIRAQNYITVLWWHARWGTMIISTYDTYKRCNHAHTYIDGRSDGEDHAYPLHPGAALPKRSIIKLDDAKVQSSAGDATLHAVFAFDITFVVVVVVVGYSATTSRCSTLWIRFKISSNQAGNGWEWHRVITFSRAQCTRRN